MPLRNVCEEEEEAKEKKLTLSTLWALIARVHLLRLVAYTPCCITLSQAPRALAVRNWPRYEWSTLCLSEQLVCLLAAKRTNTFYGIMIRKRDELSK